MKSDADAEEKDTSQSWSQIACYPICIEENEAGIQAGYGGQSLREGRVKLRYYASVKDSEVLLTTATQSLRHGK